MRIFLLFITNAEPKEEKKRVSAIYFRTNCILGLSKQSTHTLKQKTNSALSAYYYIIHRFLLVAEKKVSFFSSLLFLFGSKAKQSQAKQLIKVFKVIEIKQTMKGKCKKEKFENRNKNNNNKNKNVKQGERERDR